MVRKQRVMRLNKCYIGRGLVSFYTQPNNSFDRSANSVALMRETCLYRRLAAPG